VYLEFVEKPEEKRPLGRTTHRFDYNVKMDHEIIGWNDMDWIYLAQGREQWPGLVRMVMKLQVA
jgi:hypothetical protein